jgi:hypothetical protein
MRLKALAQIAEASAKRRGLFHWRYDRRMSGPGSALVMLLIVAAAIGLLVFLPALPFLAKMAHNRELKRVHREHERAWRERERAGLCPSCGYDRRGLPADAHCPECGAVSRKSPEGAGRLRRRGV